MTSNQASGKTTARQIRIVGVVVFGAFLALLNQTVMSPALPAIMVDFGIDASTAQWIMSIYPLVSGIMVPVSAFLIDRFSTRVLFFAATAAFAAGTALCAAAPTFFLLICGRVLQAAASGVLLPLVSVVPMLVFPVEKRGTAMGVAGIVMSAGPAVGPVLGGAIIDAYGCDQSNLIAIMQEIQGEYKYLSEGALTLIAEKLGISTAKVYSVATFYENFSLEAKGRHIIKVCTGTACHVRKSGPIYDSLRDALGLTGKRKTSADGLFTLETVACLGACGLAPVMTIDGEVHAKMTPEDALALVEDIRRKEAATA